LIVVDTSALVAIVLDEPGEAECRAVVRNNDDLLLSAGTLAELLIVAAGRNFLEETERLLAELSFEVVPVTEARSHAVGEAYRGWGRGFHAASLNFGDCFAYALAKERGCALLYVGQDFARTDVESALEESGSPGS
jgi:ribonuclease VapC